MRVRTFCSPQNNSYHDLEMYMLKLFFSLMVACSFAIGSADAQSTSNIPPLNGPVYAILSLVGDKLEMVGAQKQLGSRLDTSKRRALEINDAALDNAIINATGLAINTTQPSVRISQLNTRSKILFEKHATLFSERSGTVSIPGAIKDALIAEKATHMILVTKFRHSPSDELAQVITSEMKLEGLGFVIDAQTNTRILDTGVIDRGYLAPYFYAKVALVEVATGKLIGSKSITASSSLSSAEVTQTDGMLWDVITAQEKTEALVRLIKSEMTRVIPLMLKVG
jgi:hypothetical protein